MPNLYSASVAPNFSATRNLILGNRVEKSAADIFDGTQKAIFTISGGDVYLTLLYVTVSGAAIDASASDMKFVMNPTTGTDADMSSATNIQGDENGSIYNCPFYASNPPSGGVGGSGRSNYNGWVAPVGTIDIDTVADVGTGGALGTCVLYWLPLTDGAKVVAA